MTHETAAVSRVPRKLLGAVYFVFARDGALQFCNLSKIMHSQEGSRVEEADTKDAAQAGPSLAKATHLY